MFIVRHLSCLIVFSEIGVYITKTIPHGENISVQSSLNSTGTEEVTVWCLDHDSSGVFVVIVPLPLD